ncbi:catalase [Nocardia sp. NPDC059240]|uniref:catalase n=1 Tax=Nocardia sp. NPDC059240 TaxID=3346786 RepID=UPI003692B588
MTDTSTPEDIAARMAALTPVPRGQRMLHHRGVTVSGSFRAGPEAARLSTAELFCGRDIPVTARFSGTHGDARDADTGDQGLSVRFAPPGALPTDLIAFTLPVFFVRTGADMIEFLTAAHAGPEAMDEFRSLHPESAAALAAADNRPPASYVGQRYHAVHAFGLTAPDGENTWVRLEWHPDAELAPLEADDAAHRPAGYLTDDLLDRLPVGMTLHARLPKPGDPVHDPTTLWAYPPQLVPLGRLTLETRTADRDLDFDPLRLAPGITAPRDRLAADRSALYRVARGERTAMTTTAIIGTGTIGSRLAADLVTGGVDVLVAGREPADADRLAAQLGTHARAVTLDQAIDEADIIILAVWFDTIRELVAQYRDRLHGKIIVDPSNPIAPDGNGGFVKTIAADQSSGQLLAALLPADTALVKAFGTLGADSLSAAARRTPTRAVGFYATDDQSAGLAVESLITAAGFDPVRVGGIESAIRIEVFGDLHEFGGLGHPVDRAEAEVALGQQV